MSDALVVTVLHDVPPQFDDEAMLLRGTQRPTSPPLSPSRSRLEDESLSGVYMRLPKTTTYWNAEDGVRL
jgi:hypothetical protein